MANMTVSHLKATLACGRLSTDPALKYCSCSDRNDGADGVALTTLLSHLEMANFCQFWEEAKYSCTMPLSYFQH